jgi:hypothetical protein
VVTGAAGQSDGSNDDPRSDRSDDEARLLAVRDETRFELGLLHDRVNALLAAEAFLTIAYVGAMSNGTDWGKPFAEVAGSVLAVLGLLLAGLALPGVSATARIVLTQTALQGRLVDRLTGSPHVGYHGAGGRSSALEDQQRSLIFFRTVPLLFACVWIVLLTFTLVLLT